MPHLASFSNDIVCFLRMKVSIGLFHRKVWLYFDADVALFITFSFLKAVKKDAGVK